jgi:hypothetical protein
VEICYTIYRNLTWRYTTPEKFNVEIATPEWRYATPEKFNVETATPEWRYATPEKFNVDEKG